MSDRSPWMNEELRIFRRSVRRFVETELAPHEPRWRAQHRPDAEAWAAAGRAGMLLPGVPEEYGGGGGTLAHEIVVCEELARAGVHFGSGIQCIVARYILAYGTEAQKQRWLRRMASGELVGAIAMSEPGAGSDLHRHRDDGPPRRRHLRRQRLQDLHQQWLARRPRLPRGQDRHRGCTDEGPVASRRRGEGPCRLHGRALAREDRHARAGHLRAVLRRRPRAGRKPLGPAEGQGFFQMMEQLPYERLTIGAGAVAAAERAVAITADYVKERMAGGQALIEFQNTRFKLAECKTEARIGRVFLDHCIERFLDGSLDEVASAMAKYWLTETQCRIIDECVQLHGGYGYMTEYPIARMWADSRVQRIYAGTNEIMKEMIACSL